ncbi:MAG: diguanylate cyclase [Myxococcota bacterium]
MHILIAEDDAVSRLLLQRAVERLGHTCEATPDGAAAWTQYQQARYDVVISDWMMPDVDGLELCRRIRANETGYTYFVLLTANDDRKDRLLGMNAGADDYLTKPLDPDSLQLRLIAARRVTDLHRQILVQQEELEALNRSLYAEGRRDALTGIPNRLSLRDDIEQAQARAERGDAPYCVALFDIDNFKLYNDNLGHVAGDDALRAVAECLAAQCRAGDKVYRYGGEEFCALFHDQGLQGASIAAERMRAAVVALNIEHPANSAGPCVTVSAGVARHPATESIDIEQVLQRADEALYESKAQGRDRVRTWQQDARVLKQTA